MSADDRNLVWHASSVSCEERLARHGHKGAVVWFTGLSGSGKSSIANALLRMLFDAGAQAFILDGDNVRHGLNADLGFSDRDRVENIRRVGEVAKLFMDAGVVAVVSLISPFAADREKVRARVGEGGFFEVYLDCPFEVCKERDPKGLYARALRGEIKDFTGVDSPYEPPPKPELALRSGEGSPEECAREVFDMLKSRGVLI